MSCSVNSRRILQAIISSSQYVTALPTSAVRVVYLATSPMSTRSGESKEHERKVYTNKNGEEYLFDTQRPPRGYVYVPAGNSFVTRHCRNLAMDTGEKIYAHYRSGSKRKLAGHSGLYVPKGVLEKVKSDYNTRKASMDEKWLQDLAMAYPNMPPTDRVAICQLCRSQKVDRDIVIYRYVLDRYTVFESLSCAERNMEAATEAHQAARKILLTWKVKAEASTAA